MYTGIDSRTWGLVCNFQINDLVLHPLFKFGDAFFQVTSSLILRVLGCNDIDVGQRVREESTEVLREAVEGVVGAFESVDEDEEERILGRHFGRCWKRAVSAPVVVVLHGELRAGLGGNVESQVEACEIGA